VVNVIVVVKHDMNFWQSITSMVVDVSIIRVSMEWQSEFG